MPKNDKQVVLVTWLDSETDCGWSYGEQKYELMAIHSVGFLINVTKQALTITSTLSKNGRGKLDTLTIPLGAVLKVTKIKPNDKCFR
jgi:hypothetical protein